MYFCSSFLCGNRNYSSFCCERLWFKTRTWLFKIWVCSLNPPDSIRIGFYIMNFHIHMPGFVCLGGWMVVRSFPSYSTLRSGHTSLPLASSWAKVIVLLGHCQDQSNNRQQTTGLQKQSSAGLRWPFQQWCNVPSHPCKCGAPERGGGLWSGNVWVGILGRGVRFDGQNNTFSQRGKGGYLTTGSHTNTKKNPLKPAMIDYLFNDKTVACQ